MLIAFSVGRLSAHMSDLVNLNKHNTKAMMSTPSLIAYWSLTKSIISQSDDISTISQCALDLSQQKTVYDITFLD